uniref:Uncharacterized protein n=1 Tax=Lotus japonicus TaxID=34305 RepID=I3SHI6_LOTJA|nr:unknown [Lotus japonicus]AFK39728.1 unknown [Lotus japonicus]
MLTSAPAAKASMNSLVPDLAIVPKLFTKSALVMPIPLSIMVKVLFALSGMIWMNNSGCPSSLLLSVRLSKRILSKASEALLMSSRRKISLLE